MYFLKYAAWMIAAAAFMVIGTILISHSPIEQSPAANPRHFLFYGWSPVVTIAVDGWLEKYPTALIRFHRLLLFYLASGLIGAAAIAAMALRAGFAWSNRFDRGVICFVVFLQLPALLLLLDTSVVHFGPDRAFVRLIFNHCAAMPVMWGISFIVFDIFSHEPNESRPMSDTRVTASDE